MRKYSRATCSTVTTPADHRNRGGQPPVAPQAPLPHHRRTVRVPVPTTAPSSDAWGPPRRRRTGLASPLLIAKDYIGSRAGVRTAVRRGQLNWPPRQDLQNRPSRPATRSTAETDPPGAAVRYRQLNWPPLLSEAEDTVEELHKQAGIKHIPKPYPTHPLLLQAPAIPPLSALLEETEYSNQVSGFSAGFKYITPKAQCQDRHLLGFPDPLVHHLAPVPPEIPPLSQPRLGKKGYRNWASRFSAGFNYITSKA